MHRNLKQIFAAALLVVLVAAPVPAQENPLVSVVDFDFAATGLWWMSEFVGKGVADLITDEMINSGSYRMLERKWLAAVLAERKVVFGETMDSKPDQVGKILGADYLVVGSVTRFGTEKQTAAGIGGRFTSLFGFGRQKGKAVVAITARIVNVQTGEIVVSVQAEGTSKRSGTLLGGFVPGGAAGVSMLSSEYRDTILGEATSLAVKQVVEKLVAAKPKLTGKNQ
ncbi:MAG: hypothetical protein HY646_11985 [Acidobacteria bacterium]|nr:hypothetical protein [Acidobacteriota bacterium]